MAGTPVLRGRHGQGPEGEWGGHEAAQMLMRRGQRLGRGLTGGCWRPRAGLAGALLQQARAHGSGSEAPWAGWEKAGRRQAEVWQWWPQLLL